jgi:hypothetical protein
MGYEPTISADEPPQTYTLHRAATGTGVIIIYTVYYEFWMCYMEHTRQAAQKTYSCFTNPRIWKGWRPQMFSTSQWSSRVHSFKQHQYRQCNTLAMFSTVLVKIWRTSMYCTHAIICVSDWRKLNDCEGMTVITFQTQTYPMEICIITKLFKW